MRGKIDSPNRWARISIANEIRWANFAGGPKRNHSNANREIGVSPDEKMPGQMELAPAHFIENAVTLFGQPGGEMLEHQGHPPSPYSHDGLLR
jgi:hypothetical protein